MAGPSHPGLSLPLKEALSYDSLTLSHGEYLAKSLLSRCQLEPTIQQSLWFDDFKNNEALSAEAATKVLNAIFTALLHNQYAITHLPEGMVDKGETQLLFLTVSDNVSQRKTCFGSGKGLLQAVNSAMQSLSKEDAEFDFLSVKLDIVQEVKSLPHHDVESPLPFERSLYGLAFDSKLQLAFLQKRLSRIR